MIDLRRAASMLMFSLAACGHSTPVRRATPPTSCLPAPLRVSPALAREQAMQIERLLNATDSSHPDHADLLVRLAENYFAGGFVSRGCALARTAAETEPGPAVTAATRLHREHCSDDRAQRCDAWVEP